MPIIVPADPADLQDLLMRLLEAAGDQPFRIRTVTSTTYLSFDVDQELYDAIGYAPALAGADTPKVAGKTKKSTAPSGDATSKEGTP